MKGFWMQSLLIGDYVESGDKIAKKIGIKCELIPLLLPRPTPIPIFGSV